MDIASTPIITTNATTCSQIHQYQQKSRGGTSGVAGYTLYVQAKLKFPVFFKMPSLGIPIYKCSRIYTALQSLVTKNAGEVIPTTTGIVTQNTIGVVVQTTVGAATPKTPFDRDYAPNVSLESYILR
jgi:hypothetical protein